MNYGELLFKAHENHKNTSQTTKNVPCYKTAFAPPKKLGRPTVLSENIKKFLAKKEEEEKKKNLEARKKKAELLALRSQDKKAQKRVQVMLKRTKSANKSVMEDAIDNVNTRDTLDGPMQCDEDDYGYVSQEASAFYAKMMNKYENMPSEPSIFSKSKREVKDLAAAKDRVKAALRKEEEESELPHKRKRKKGEESGEGDKKLSSDEREKNVNSHDKYKDDKYKENDKRKESDSDKNKEEKKKPRKPAPPPINFDQLLKLAEVKQHEPIIIETPSAPKEPERLMTQKEKEEFLREEERKRNRNKRPSNSDVSYKDSTQTQKPSKSSIEPSSISKKPTEMAKKPISKDKDIKDKGHKIKSNEQDKVKVSSADRIRKEINPSEKSNNNNNYINHKVVPKPNKSVGDKDRLAKPSDSKQVDKNIVRKGAEKGTVDSTLLDIDREIELLKKKRMLLAASGNNKQNPSVQKPKMVDNKDRLNSNKPQMRQMEMKSIDKKPDKMNSGKMLNLKPKKPLEKMKSKKRRIDSDSEYDSELDDFIDDGPEETEDYSKYISEIFGYDKSKYRDVDDDDECMESNFAQQMREEFVSTKIGILEDLEDIQKEQEEKKRLKKKRLK